MVKKNWEIYEETAQYLLNKFANHFGVGQFDGKQVIPGESGTTWEIDAKGYNTDNGQFIIVECKRHTKNGIPQSIAASLAYVINDTGAKGGIIVSPIGLQEGAKKVANHSNIIEVKLTENSTKDNYIIDFLKNTVIGMTENFSVGVKEQLVIKIVENGQIIRTEKFGDLDS